ncbi:MAG: right-handed parallel beta-helix repeat-containing protein, partial [Candidatus Aenigmarchaeota archaeon]|nr:right-handed parallel beta-helix repeat-containing protein [Candidatus Aenigmarchaeota archaeon]
NGSVFVENYSCSENGYEISKVLTGGSHTLEFRFGNDTEYAHNFATFNCSTCTVCSNYLLNTSMQSGDVLQLTASLSGVSGTCISFGGKDNHTFDCLGNTLDGDDSGTDYGIWLNETGDGSNNNTIRNCTVTDFYYGIYLSNSSNNTMLNITGSSNNYSFYLSAPLSGSFNYNRIINAIANNNTNAGIYCVGLLSTSLYNSFINITANYNSQSSSSRGISLTTVNFTLINVIAQYNYDGIYLSGASNGTLYNITVNHNTDVGIMISSSSFNQFSHVFAKNNTDRNIYFDTGSNNTLNDSVTEDSPSWSVYLFGSIGNNITNLTIINNYQGIRLYNNVQGNINNIIKDCTIKNNTNAGISFANSGGPYVINNTFYNNFLNNSVNLVSDNSNNLNYWNVTKNCSSGPNIIGGPCIGGNYWTDPDGNFSDTCTDTDGDGICQSSYPAATNNTDYLPLAENPPQLIFVSPTLSNQSYTQNQSWIYVNVSANETLSWCTLNWYNGSWQNVSMDVSGSYCYVNMTSLTSGSYYFRVYGNDSAGNMNVTEDRQANVDLTSPYYQYDQDNSSGEVNEGETVQSSAYWNDLLSDLGAAVLRTNETGSWANKSSHAFSGKPEYSNFTINTEGYGDKTICWVIWANDTEGNMNSSMDLGGHCFNVIAGESTLTIESIAIQPDEGNPGIIINPVEGSNKSVNVTVTVTNSTSIDACEVRIFNSSASYSDPVFLYAGTIQNCAATCDCFKEWDMEYWRNDGDWNVSVYINLTTGVGNFTSQNFTYNSLFSITVNASTITFTGIPEQTVNSTDAYPLEIKNTGNQIVNISMKGTNFTGLSNPSYVVGVGNSTYNETQNGTFEQLTNGFVQVFEDLTPSGARNLFFRAYLPLGFIQQDYQNTIEIAT